jgi:hypothetical protein
MEILSSDRYGLSQKMEIPSSGRYSLSQKIGNTFIRKVRSQSKDGNT